MSRGIYIREPGVENCAHAEVCEHACRMGCKAYEPRVDRESLLGLADEMQGHADAHDYDGDGCINAGCLWSYADRIREALGVG